MHSVIAQDGEDVNELKHRIQQLQEQRKSDELYIQHLETELKNLTDAVRASNQKTIQPLKHKLDELEQRVKDKEYRGRSLKRKIHKLKVQLDNERKINFSLAKRISLAADRADRSSKIDYKRVYDLHSNSIEERQPDMQNMLNQDQSKVSR